MVDPNPAVADPSMIGGIGEAPFVLRPDPRRLFTRRADRFADLAQDHALTPYLRFLEALTRVQADLVPTAQANAGPMIASGSTRPAPMPAIDRDRLAEAPELAEVLDRLFDAARTIKMPRAAQDALASARSASPDGRVGMCRNILSDAVPADGLAQHVFVAAAVQVVAACTAFTIDAARLTPVGTGVCPACGGLPVSSMVVGFVGAEGVRYAVCSCCATQWNEVRVKCLACGSTKGISYREIDSSPAVKAEICDECGAWVKIMYQNRDPALDPVADDVASLGLDLLVRDAGFRHAGFNPFLTGY